MFIHVTNRTLCGSSNRCDASLLLVLHMYCITVHILPHFSNIYFRSSDVLFYTYCITYTHYIATYVCMYINFDTSPRSTARALIRTSLGLLERSDTSEKPLPNPNFVRVAGAIWHFVLTEILLNWMTFWNNSVRFSEVLLYFQMCLFWHELECVIGSCRYKSCFGVNG